jgi:TfoX/Sxy family transcriptional regulator of competence genes
MFGKSGVFCEGVMFGMITGNILYLRVDERISYRNLRSRRIAFSTSGKTRL